MIQTFFQPFLCNRKFISFQLYWLIKGLVFDILCGSFTIFSWFNGTFIAYIENTYCHYFLDLLLLFYFLTIFKNLCMLHCDFMKFVGQYINTIKKAHYLSLILLHLFDIFVEENQNSLQLLHLFHYQWKFLY